MARYLCIFLLLGAVALFGVLPHAVMAAGQQATPTPCQNEHSITGLHTEATGHCGPTEHALSGACATACLGTVTIWFPPLGRAQLVLRPMHRAVAFQLLHGRTDDTDDRPPKFI